MSKSRLVVFAGLIITLFLLTSPTQAAAATMKFRAVLFHNKVEAMEVEHIEGHVIGVFKSTGLASLETGEVAVMSQHGTFDYIKGAGTHMAYARLTFEDGSTIDYNYHGTTALAPEGKGAIFKDVSVEITGGTGKYAGIRGGGSYTGRRIVPGIAGAQFYSDSVLIYTLP